MFGKVGKQFADQIAGQVEQKLSQHLSKKAPQVRLTGSRITSSKVLSLLSIINYVTSFL